MRAEDDIIIILNSDIKVDADFLDPLIEHFIKDPDVCFVSSRMYYFDGVTYQGDRAKARDHFGIISADTRFEGYEGLIEKTGPTFSTGNGAFDRKKVLRLGGFDEIYLPGRYEDVDLCFRAWKSGYKGIYEPKSIIYHKGYESFKKAFSDKDIYAMVFRNSILFMLKNITDVWPRIKFCFWLPPRLLFFILAGKAYLAGGFWRALLLLPEVGKRRKEAVKTFKLSDKQVLDIVG
jgi:GT2 family glycosyltransferase